MVSVARPGPTAEAPCFVPSGLCLSAWAPLSFSLHLCGWRTSMRALMPRVLVRKMPSPSQRDIKYEKAYFATKNKRLGRPCVCCNLGMEREDQSLALLSIGRASVGPAPQTFPHASDPILRVSTESLGAWSPWPHCAFIFSDLRKISQWKF